MNKNIKTTLWFVSILTIFLFAVSSVSAYDNVTLGDRPQEEDGGSYLWDVVIDNKEGGGLCMDPTDQGPHGADFTVTDADKSEISNKLTDSGKKVIMKYYRLGNSYETNRALQLAFWAANEGASLVEKGKYSWSGKPWTDAEYALANKFLSEYNIGSFDMTNSLYIDENGRVYKFYFYIGTTSNPATWPGYDRIQDVALFTYDVYEDDGSDNGDNSTTDDGTTSENNNIENKEFTEAAATSNIAMESTGNPIVLLLVLLFAAGLGIAIRK